MVWFELLPNGRLGIRFPYKKDHVDAVRALPDRRWDKEAERWEIPLASLKDAAAIFQIPFESIPKTIRDVFEETGAGKTLLMVDNTWTHIQGSDLPMSALDEETSFWVLGAEYSTHYQNGFWDGHHRLMKKRGGLAFPTGLLNRVKNTLVRSGHDFVTQDLRQIPEHPAPLAIHGPELRDYQTQVLQAVTQSERGVLQLATGAGKTLVAAHIIAAKGLFSLFFVHTKDLLYQAIQVFETILGIPIGQVGDGRIDLKPVTVATVQTAARALDVKLEKSGGDEETVWEDEASARLSPLDLRPLSEALASCQLAIFDECHHLPADTFYEIAMKLPKAFYRYGLSATPWRSDRADLMIEAALGPKMCVVNSTDLIQRGYLVAPKITMYEVLPVGRKEIRNYPQVYKREVVEHPERNQLIAEVAAHSVARNKSVLILVNQVRHGRILEKLIEGSVFIHGGNASEVRGAALEQLRQKTHPILIATTLADEGLDLPSLDVLILAGAGKSETRALQRVGRVLRPYEGKTTATIVDFWDQALYLEEHSRQRYEIYRTEPSFEVDIRPPRKPGKTKSRQKTLAEN